MHNILFLNDYQCGKYDIFNTLDWNKYPYWDNNNFYTSQFKYINSYENSIKKPPQSFDNKMQFMRDKFKTISSYEYLRKPNQYKKSILLYEVCVYSNAINAFGNQADFLLDKIPSKILEIANKNSNVFIVLNYTSEGFISEEQLENINEWIQNNIPFFQFILVHANYNIFNWYDSWIHKKQKELDLIATQTFNKKEPMERFTVIPYQWSLPMLVHMVRHEGFSNQQLTEHYDFETIKTYDFNCLMRRLTPLRIKLLLDFDKLNLLKKNQISYDTNQPGVSDEDFFNYIEQINPNKKDIEMKRFNKIRKQKPKQTVDYDDILAVKGIGMETNIPYKDSMFTVVAESYFWQNQNIGYISEKTWKPILHKHPFIIFGNVNVLAHLQHWGFKTYGETGFLDESYDTEKDPYKRYVMVMEQIQHLCNLSKEDKKAFMFNASKIANFNYEHFKKFNIESYNKTFEDYLKGLVIPKVSLEQTLF